MEKKTTNVGYVKKQEKIMKDKDKKCIKCNELVEMVTDKDYPKLDYYYCNNLDCPRCGLITLIFK